MSVHLAATYVQITVLFRLAQRVRQVVWGRVPESRGTDYPSGPFWYPTFRPSSDAVPLDMWLLNYHSGSYARIFLRFTYSNWRPYLSFMPFVLPSQNRGKAISQLLSRSPSIVERNPPRVRDRNAAPLLGSNVSIWAIG